MKGNPVRFIYISAGNSRPTPIDPDAIYFMEGDKQIWVGNTCIADSVEPVDITSYLAPYLIKSMEVVGSGSAITDAQIDETTGKITFTKGDIALSKGVSPESIEVDLEPGDQFTVMSETTVSGTTIYDQTVKFKLPVQVVNANIRGEGSLPNKTYFLDLVFSDNSTVSTQISIFDDIKDYVTSRISEVQDDIDSKIDDVKGYVDQHVSDAVSSAISDLGTIFEFRGESSTPITDGGREEPTIAGEPVDPTQGMKKGDVVTYNGQEFLWNGESWQAFGSADAGHEYTIVSKTPGQGYSASYQLQKDGVDVGTTINIPQSSIIESSSIETVVEPDVPYPGAVPGDKYIDLVTGDDVDDHIYIPAEDIAVVYTAGQGIEITDEEVIQHVSVGDGSSIDFVDAQVDENDQNSLIFTQKHINRDLMGHVVDASTDSEPVLFEILSKEGVRNMILEYVPTWVVEEAQNEHSGNNSGGDIDIDPDSSSDDINQP